MECQSFEVPKEIIEMLMVILRCRYASQTTFDRHFAAPEYAEFQATLKAENIIDFGDPKDAEIRVVHQVAGFL